MYCLYSASCVLHYDLVDIIFILFFFNVIIINSYLWYGNGLFFVFFNSKYSAVSWTDELTIWLELMYSSETNWY